MHPDNSSASCREHSHLAKFPDYNEKLIDSVLEAEMQLAQNLSSAILSLRKKEKYLRRKDQMIKAENAKKALALSKLHLGLADQGVIHTDLGYAGERPDHLVYDPYSNKMQAIDFNQVQTFKHSNNLHKHTRNQNLLSEELQEYSPQAQARHFLDHKSKSIFNGRNFFIEDAIPPAQGLIFPNASFSKIQTE